MPKRSSHRKVLGQAISHYRLQAKMTHQQLAEAADLSPKFVRELELMGKNISVDALARIAKALKVRLWDLVRDI